MTTAEQNKEVVRAFYDALQREDYPAAAALCHEDFVFYFQLDTPIPGTAGFVASEKKNFDAFPGFRFTIESLFAAGDQVAAYMIFDGQHGAEWEGVAPTGNRVRFSLMMLLRLLDGKIVEKRAHFDRHDIRQQVVGQG
ncbi:ester cyclase [Deinococcus navajonensis]|uniref:Ester cyclase n=1 Tax=Deinococcus navajonensis TaxID=309884 RepID=A0ABV8XKP3_9DEIO